MVRPRVLYNKRALQISAALDATCDHLDQQTSFDRISIGSGSKSLPVWIRREFQGAECVRLQRNREVVIRTLALNGDANKLARGEAMEHIDPQFRVNRDFVHSAVQVNGLALKHAPEEFKADRELVITAVCQNGLALEYAASTLKDDCEVCCYAVAQTEKAMAHVGPLQRRSYEVFLAADRTGKLRDDRQFILRAMQEEPHLLQYASKRLSMDTEVVAAACREDGLCLAYANRVLKADLDIVKVAVEQNGLALQYAGSSMQGSISAVNAAITQNGMALQFASDQLKADKRVVLRACQQTGLALQFAHVSMRSDKGVVVRALKENPKAWAYVHRETKMDPEFSTKKWKAYLLMGADMADFSDEDAFLYTADLPQDQEQDFYMSARKSMPFVGELPLQMPDHPPNGALVPTWQMQQMQTFSTSRPSTMGGSPMIATASSAFRSPKLPSLQRSFSTPSTSAMLRDLQG